MAQPQPESFLAVPAAGMGPDFFETYLCSVTRSKTGAMPWKNIEHTDAACRSRKSRDTNLKHKE